MAGKRRNKQREINREEKVTTKRLAAVAALMNRRAVTAFLLSLGFCMCVFFTHALSAQNKARVQTGPKEYWQDHHDTSMSLRDMIRFYPQPNPPTKPWVRPELP